MIERNETFFRNQSAAMGEYSREYIDSLKPAVGKYITQEKYAKLRGQSEQSVSRVATPSVEPELPTDTIPTEVRQRLISILYGNDETAPGVNDKAAKEVKRAITVWPLVKYGII